MKNAAFQNLQQRSMGQTCGWQSKVSKKINIEIDNLSKNQNVFSKKVGRRGDKPKHIIQKQNIEDM